MSGEDFFQHVKMGPADPILGLNLACKADPNPDKINLTVGAYRDDDGLPHIFDSVKKAEELILEDPVKYNKEYAPITGYAPFVEAAQKLIFGEDCQALKDGRVCSTQTLSGTGSLTVAFNFLAEHCPAPVYVSDPTWGNHNAIVTRSGLPLRTYTYWDAEKRGINFEGMIKTIGEAPTGSIFLLHPCAHNPTGVDPTEEQWHGILKACKEKKHIVLFDSAYQGFATGDFERDAFSIRLFMKEGVNFLLCQSFAKNFGLYGERVGCLHFVCGTSETAKKVESQVKIIIRCMYSSPPIHGAYIVDIIYRNKPLFEQMLIEIRMVSERIIDMRKALYDE